MRALSQPQTARYELLLAAINLNLADPLPAARSWWEWVIGDDAPATAGADAALIFQDEIEAEKPEVAEPSPGTPETPAAVSEPVTPSPPLVLPLALPVADIEGCDRMQSRCLHALARVKDGLTVHGIIDATGYSRSKVAPVLTRLKDKGWVGVGNRGKTRIWRLVKPLPGGGDRKGEGRRGCRHPLPARHRGRGLSDPVRRAVRWPPTPPSGWPSVTASPWCPIWPTRSGTWSRSRNAGAGGRRGRAGLARPAAANAGWSASRWAPATNFCCRCWSPGSRSL